MTLTKDKTALPSDDNRWKIVHAAMRQNGFEPSGLIETLNAVQSSFGFLTEESLRFVAAGLRVPLSKVFGVATFYHLFSMKPHGKHTCVVCTGTACYIKGAPRLLDAIDKSIGVKPGETSDDGNLSVLTARCIGACGLAPAGTFDSEVLGNLSPETTVGKIKTLLGKISVG